MFALGDISQIFIEKLFSHCFRPQYPEEEAEDETVIEDDAELTMDKLNEELMVGDHSHYISKNANYIV